MNKFLVTLALVALVGNVLGSGYGRGRPDRPHRPGHGDIDISDVDVDIPDVDIDSKFNFKGHWSKWGSWGSCSKKCGGGVQTRSRECVRPKHRYFGKFKGCEGDSSESRKCNTQACPVDGMWSNWGPFGGCSKTCGGGIKQRDRTCTNPAPANGGKGCKGPAWEKMDCNTQGCPVDGMWSNWGPFGGCSKTCGGGIKQRDRTCTNPAPANGGKGCDGPAWEKMECNTQSCKVDGMWSNWGPFSDCSRKCGGGFKRRDRQCNNPAPSNGGRNCRGPGWDKMKCNTHKCRSHFHH